MRMCLPKNALKTQKMLEKIEFTLPQKDSMTSDSIYSYESAIKDFKTIAGWKDSNELIEV